MNRADEAAHQAAQALQGQIRIANAARETALKMDAVVRAACRLVDSGNLTPPPQEWGDLVVAVREYRAQHGS
jgi:hypothetical protein